MKNIQRLNIPQLNAQDEKNQNLAKQINTQLNSFDLNNPKGLVKQTLKDCLGLNFKNFNNTYARNNHNFGPEKIYFLSHNLRTNFEKDKIIKSDFDEFASKYNAPKFDQISNNFLSREKDYYKEFVEINGNIGINNLNNVHNITSELRKINANNPFNYMQENPDFDFNNNRMGLFLLLQQNGNTGKIFDSQKSKLSTSYKRCNEHRRRREMKRKEKNLEKNPKSFMNNRIISSDKSSGNSFKILSSKKTSNIKDYTNKRISNDMSISSLSQRNIYLNEEENNLFEKYFNSFIPYFKELINNKKINTNGKILKLREVLDRTIDIFREGRKNFCEFMKRLITPLNNNDNSNKLTTKFLIARIIKYLENDFERKNYMSSQGQAHLKKEDFLSNYTNTIIYTYFSNVTSHSKSQTILLWTKIYFYIRFGWKRECIDFINHIEGIYLNESGLKEMKDSLDDSKKITIQNYNEFKRILNQENKNENPFKHACMVYMTKIPEQLYDNILLEINDHLWFNLNLINPQDNYEHLIKKKDDNDNKNEFEIDTSSNKNNDERIIELIKLKDLQMFFDSTGTQNLIYSNNKNTNFVYIILLIGLLRFKTAVSFMIKNNMYEDAINFCFILKQLGIYSDFDKIDEKIINNAQKKINLENINQREEIYQIYPNVTDNIPALMLYLIFSESNFIQPLSNLILETEAFGILNNYHKNMPLFNNNNNNMNINNNQIINSFNVCLKEIMDEKTLIKLCKNIFQLLLKHKIKNNASLNPLFNTFKDLKLLTELTGLLIKKSLELINLKKPVISFVKGELCINLVDNNNQKFIGYNLVMNHYGSLMNDVNQLFIEKQNELQLLVNNNRDNRHNEKIFLLQREIDENNISISLVKQLPIIENIYECIFTKNFNEAFSLYMDNISLVKIGFDNDEEDYINEFTFFVNEILKKLKYGLIALYPDILYFFVWLLKIELIEFQQKGYYKIIGNLKDKSKALEFLLDRLVEMSRNDQDLMEYAPKFIMAKNEVNQIQQFYHQNNYII